MGGAVPMLRVDPSRADHVLTAVASPVVPAALIAVTAPVVPPPLTALPLPYHYSHLPASLAKNSRSMRKKMPTDAKKN